MLLRDITQSSVVVKSLHNSKNQMRSIVEELSNSGSMFQSVKVCLMITHDSELKDTWDWGHSRLAAVAVRLIFNLICSKRG